MNPRAALLTLAMLTPACASPASRAATPGLPTLSINGSSVQVTSSQTALDVVRSRLTVYRLGYATRASFAPRYFVDHVEIIDGAAWLARTRATEIDSVRALSATESITRFGGSARGGAILIFTAGRR